MTISDIAKMAGVSSAAVSRYLNGGPLSEQKREAIRDAICILLPLSVFSNSS